MAIYHMHISNGSRAGGQSASAKADYVVRAGRYEGRADRVFSESVNMPSWVTSPDAFWQGADDWSRANARLYTEVEVALPRELDRRAQVALVRNQVEVLTTRPEGRIPCTWAIHDDGKGNPHAHLVLASRVDDGLARADARTWFSRAATGKTAPQLGGARSWAEATNKEWVQATRAQWAELANQALQQAGQKARLDHRSYAAQDAQLSETYRRVPTRHEGWSKGWKRREAQEHNNQVRRVRRMVGDYAADVRAWREQERAEAKAAQAEREAKRQRTAQANARVQQRPEPPRPTQGRPQQAPGAPQPSWEALTHAGLARRAREAQEALDKARAADWSQDRDQVVRAAQDQASTATRELLRMEAVQRGLPPGLSQAQRDSSLKEAVSARLEFDARREEKVRGRGRKPGTPNPDSS